MAPVDPTFQLLERIADVANELGIETAVIGAVAMAAHNYVRATADADLGTYVDPYAELGQLRDTLAARGLHVELRTPDEDDPLGGVLRVWERENADRDPIEYVDVVNFKNPHRPGHRTPGFDAIRCAAPVEGRCCACARFAPAATSTTTGSFTSRRSTSERTSHATPTAPFPTH